MINDKQPTWKETAKRNIRAMTPAAAAVQYASYLYEQRHGATIKSETVRKITGGYQSQSINFEVIRALAARKGVLS